MEDSHLSVSEPRSRHPPGSESDAASSGDSPSWQDPYAAWERGAKLDPNVPGKVTDLKAMNFDGVDLDHALKNHYLLRIDENFYPRQDKPVYKHPLNDYDYEAVVEAIKEHWLNMGCHTNDED